MAVESIFCFISDKKIKNFKKLKEAMQDPEFRKDPQVKIACDAPEATPEEIRKEWGKKVLHIHDKDIFGFKTGVMGVMGYDFAYGEWKFYIFGKHKLADGRIFPTRFK